VIGSPDPKDFYPLCDLELLGPREPERYHAHQVASLHQGVSEAIEEILHSADMRVEVIQHKENANAGVCHPV
jgi:3-dehydroquinate dehydratase